jgi:hypothetical protein
VIGGTDVPPSTIQPIGDSMIGRQSPNHSSPNHEFSVAMVDRELAIERFSDCCRTPGGTSVSANHLIIE